MNLHELQVNDQKEKNGWTFEEIRWKYPDVDGQNWLIWKRHFLTRYKNKFI